MSDEKKDEIKTFRKMRRLIRITWICFGLSMVIYSLSVKTIGIVPVWVFGWLASLIGWWSWYRHASPFGMCLNEEIANLEGKEKEEKSE